MNPRALAIQILARVEATEAYLNAVLDSQLSEHPQADRRDAALVSELCYGATRRRMALDFGLAKLSERPLSKLEGRVLAALRVGAYQLHFLRVPPHAAVGATVEALKQLGLARAAPLVNAVLRKLSLLPALPLPPREPLGEHLSVRESHPRWLVDRWLARYGEERAQAMLLADNQPAPVVIRANLHKLSREELLSQLQQAGVEARPSALSPSGVVLPRPGRLEELYGYAEGLWQVQDEAAQLVVQFASFPLGARAWDACAAPGGKSCQLAEGGEVLATDLHPGKLRKLEAEARRLGVGARIRTLAHDAETPLPEELGDFPAVLVDAPCSGLGTLRRHPELRYRRKEEEIARLAELQGRILGSCQRRVRPGGLLVFSVCSTEPEEGAEQVKRFLSAHPGYQLEPPPEWNGPLEGGFLVTLPGPEGLDGFFAARLRRARSS